MAGAVMRGTVSVLRWVLFSACTPEAVVSIPIASTCSSTRLFMARQADAAAPRGAEEFLSRGARVEVLIPGSHLDASQYISPSAPVE